jgi:hypothetical protein
MRVISCCVLILHLAAGIARAQTYNNLQIQLGPYTSSKNGGEQPVGAWRSTGPVVIGKPVTSTFSVGEACKAFTVSSAESLRENAVAAWKIDVTPTRVVGDAVSFRLKWRMAGGRQQGDRFLLEFSDSPSPTEEIELTLRPGESFPVYTLRNIHGYSCNGLASIRVSVDHYPEEADEHRLVAADLWLVERLPNGNDAQRGETLSIRGLPNHPVRFYFDSLVDANMSLDIYGLLQARLASGTIAVTLETRCQWRGGSTPKNIIGPQRSVKSEIEVKPVEIVEVQLPPLGDDAGPFAKRAFAIRIRMRQLR